MPKSFNSVRYNEYNRQKKFNLSWKLSLKYSNLLLNQINKDINNYDYYRNIYKQFIIELKSRKLNIKNTKYIRIWKDFMNTLNKNNLNNIKNCGLKLQYTSLINNIN